jgi:hypothetical protein
MKLSAFIKQLVELEAQGHGESPVYYRHGASGDCGPLSTPFATDERDDQGPFDLKKGESYISVYAGN